MKTNITILFLSLFLLLGCTDVTNNAIDKNDTTSILTPTETLQEQGEDSTRVAVSSVAPSQTEETDETEETEETSPPLPQIIKKRDSNDSEIVKEWYIRLVVEDTNNTMKIANTQLGQLDRIDTIQNYALKAIVPFVRRYLDVVFKNPTNFEAGEYKSIFHTVDTEADSWDFTVKSYDNTANMILGFRGLYTLTPYTDSQDRLRYHENYAFMHPLLKKMTLLDIDENREVVMVSDNKINEYLFNMNGVKERHFRWKLYTDVPIIAPKIASKMRKMEALELKVLRLDASAKPDSLKAKRLEAIDMNHPPKFEVLDK
jgi:hypothetical protein